MALTDIKAAQLEIAEEMKALRERMKSLGEKLFREGAQEIFDNYPDLVSFSWTQYTPYFNDGDECTFGVNAEYGMKLKWVGKEESDEDDYYNDEDEFSPSNVRYADPSVELPSYFRDLNDKRWLFEAGGVIVDLVSGIDEATMRDLFGDHVRVIVSRDGIDVESYDHD